MPQSDLDALIARASDHYNRHGFLLEADVAVLLSAAREAARLRAVLAPLINAGWKVPTMAVSTRQKALFAEFVDALENAEKALGISEALAPKEDT